MQNITNENTKFSDPEINTFLTKENSNRVIAMSITSICNDKVNFLRTLDAYSLKLAHNYLLSRYEDELPEEIPNEQTVIELLHIIVGIKYETSIKQELTNMVQCFNGIVEEVCEMLNRPAPMNAIAYNDLGTAEVILIDCIGKEIQDRENVKQFIIDIGAKLFDDYYPTFFESNLAATTIKNQCTPVICVTPEAKPKGVIYRYNHHMKFVVAEWWKEKGLNLYLGWKTPNKYKE